MSNIKGKYVQILEDLENNIKNPEDLDYAKEKMMELSMAFMDVIDRLTALTDAKIKEIEARQEEINNKVSNVQSLVNEIESDIYEEDEGYEFEIVCPYCNYEFTADIEEDEKEEIKCPKCNNIIELDWDQEEDCSSCEANCPHHSSQVAEEDKKYKLHDEDDNSDDQDNKEDEDM